MATLPAATYVTPEQKAALQGKKVLLLSSGKWHPAGFPAAAIANICSVYSLYNDNGAKIWLCTPGPETDPTYNAYVDNNIIAGVVLVPDMWEENGGEAVANAVKESGITFDGIYTGFEMLQPLWGEVCERLGIKHNPHKAYLNARDKYATRKVLEAAGLPTPKSAPIASEADIPAVVEKLGFPMIIKPVLGAGSLGVYKAFNEDELRQGVARVLEDMQTQAYLKPDATMSTAAPMVVEQLLIPKDFNGLPVGEFDVDLTVWDGELKYAAVTDNWYPIKPYYLENGNTFPSLVPEDVQKELIDYCFKCVLALGFFKGVFHMEAIYTDEGPRLIECNPRVGGGPVAEYSRKLMGVEMAYEIMMTALNIPVNPKPKNEKPERCMVTYYLNCPKTGTLEDTDFLEFLNDDPDVLRKVYFVTAGAEVKGYDTQVPMWIAEIVFEGPVSELNRLTDKMVATVERATALVKVRNEGERRPSRRPSLLESGVPEHTAKEGEKDFVDI